ncbi:MAG: potassium channel protein [Oscillatoriales cyanobacterium SM2_2_1]|nr:potassium channel protein [Oscillatoriales cyanobacterium SM2_2_1]
MQRILTGLLSFACTIVIAVSGYMIAGWNFLDAIYMVVITVFGVGYGEPQPVSTPALRIFTMFVIISGALSTAYTVAGFVQMITEGEIHRALGARRKMKELQSLTKHTIICGYGQVGQILCRRLKEEKKPFVIVEGDDERAIKAKGLDHLVVHSNPTDEQSLIQAGIHQARILATVMPDDTQNVFITLTARELNPNLVIIARGETPSTEKKLKLAGADQVVMPAAIGADRIAQTIINPSVIDFLQESEGRASLNEMLSQINIQLDELIIASDSPFVRKTLSDVETRGRGTFIIIAVRQADGLLIDHPPHDFILGAGDTVILLGHRGDIPQFAQKFAMKREIRYRGAQT